VILFKATNSAALPSKKRKRSTEDVDGDSNKMSRSPRTALDKRKRSVDENDEEVNTKKLRTSNHIIGK